MINVKVINDVCFIKFNRPNAKNSINLQMINELEKTFELYEDECKIIVLEGNNDYFCFGADFGEISDNVKNNIEQQDPGKLYDLWNRMINNKCIIVSHVNGKVNAGGVGFIAASDLVIAGSNATFSLSELLFGLMPAMVIPFLIRRIGFAKANYLTITTKTIDVNTALKWQLVDIYSETSDRTLKQYLARMSKLPKEGIIRYKKYINKICSLENDTKEKAIEANLEVFSDEVNLKKIYNFTQNGIYPWED